MLYGLMGFDKNGLKCNGLEELHIYICTLISL